MKNMKFFLPFLLVIVALSWSATPVQAQEGVLLKIEALPDSNYCHLQFPAIQEDTLALDRPVLKDPASGDIIDFYGPCDHDPLGKDEIVAQQQQRRERQMPDGE
ncbi:MAG TPA: hypothetical protein VGA09_06500 [Candidatus Binatia bacterium]